MKTEDVRDKGPWGRELIESFLPSEVQKVFQMVASVAGQAGFPVYTVGGLVRDLWLRKRHEENRHGQATFAAPENENGLPRDSGIFTVKAQGSKLKAQSSDPLRARPDVDLVVEGNGLSVARELAARLVGKIRIHKWYGTAVLLLPSGLRVDVATARRERYERPAAPPQIEPASIQDDLYRRDFSINALAIRLNGPEAYRLVDDFGGLRDLEEGLIRVLHPRSFIEDPSRILRAIRFEQRFAFAIEESTLKLMQEAIEEGWVGRLSGPKLWLELTYLLREKGKAPLKNIRRMSELGLLKFIHPHLILTDRLEELLARVEEVLGWYRSLHVKKEDGRRAPSPEEDAASWSTSQKRESLRLQDLQEIQPSLLYLMGLVSGLMDPEVEEVFQRLSLRPEEVRKLKVAQRHVPIVAEELAWARDIPPGKLYRLLSPLPPEALLWLAVQAPTARIRPLIACYLTELRDMEPFLRGRDLVKLGLRPGPVFKEILNQTRELRLNGVLKTREDEIQFVKEHYL
ncbi:MAG: CCA tRNA nucleotidyltransferase [Nitrospinae bacterium]|nr:CCA tRNA nucleotidyltransferase [Nitrospinota bacterium]